MKTTIFPIISFSLVLSSLPVFAAEVSFTEVSFTEFSYTNAAQLTAEINSKKEAINKIMGQMLVKIPHAQTVLASKVIANDLVQLSAASEKAYGRKKLFAISYDYKNKAANNNSLTCMTKLKTLLADKGGDGRNEYFPYFTGEKQRTIIDAAKSGGILAEYFSADSLTPFFDEKSSTVILLQAEGGKLLLNGNAVVGFHPPVEEGQEEHKATACIASLLETVSQMECKSIDKDGNYQITLNEALIAANSKSGNVYGLGGYTGYTEEVMMPYRWNDDPAGGPADLSSAILGSDKGSALFLDNGKKGREKYNNNYKTMNSSLGYVVLFEPDDTSVCDHEKGKISLAPEVVR